MGCTMRFLQRRGGPFRRPAADGPDRTPQGGRYGHRPGGSNEPLFAPPRRPATAPRRTDPSDLLGRSVLDARTQQAFREYGLLPRFGPAAGLSRCYLARDTGLEIAADGHGVVTTVFLHFYGDDGFASYRGEISGGGGTVPRRAALWAALGRPAESGEAYRERYLGDFGPWDRWALEDCILHAQYALDGESLLRITLTAPARPA